MTTSSAPILALGLMLALPTLLVAGSSPVTAATGAAAVTCSTSGVDTGDVDGDGRPDFLVGVPRLTVAGRAGAGGVEVQLSGNTFGQRLTATGAGGTPRTGGSFGAAVSIADLDHDGCSDIAVGEPGNSGKGAVHLLRGNKDGVAAMRTIVAPDGEQGDDFGAAVVETVRSTEAVDLWIGAPGGSIAGVKKAGRVYHYLVDGAGVPSLVGTASYATAGVPGAPAAGDRFGAVLAATSDGVIVGVPRRKVAGKAGAGQVVVLSQRDKPLAAEVFDQSTAVVPGTAEAGDRFGAAVAVAPAGSAYAVGSPGEDIGRRTDAGSMSFFRHDDGELHSLKPTVRTYTQDSPGVPGVAEAADEFGASVLVGLGMACPEQRFGFAVGAPGEAIGSAKSAGMVDAFPLLRNAGCPSVGYRQGYPHGGTHLGTPETGDRFGAALAVQHLQASGSTEILNSGLIGVPGEDGAKPNSGIVQLTGRLGTIGAIDGPVAQLRFGQVIAVPAYNDSI